MERPSLKSDVIFSIACLLLCAFLLHTLLFNHQHPAFMGDASQAIVHGEDRKWLVVLAVALVLFAAQTARDLLYDPSRSSAPSPVFPNGGRPVVAGTRDPILRQISGGIIHPKLCA